MPHDLPDLWRLGEDSRLLYTIFLSRLQQHDLHERVISASRQIREYAVAGPGAIEGVFTFIYEIESLCSLKRYHDSWKQLELRAVQIFGQPPDLDQIDWPRELLPELERFYVPLLYFRERYDQGCRLMEISLEPWFWSKRTSSYELLFRVFNSDVEPQCLPRVTLSHYYRELGWPLSQWRRWEAFVRGFPAKFFQLTEIARDELLANSELLASFSERLMDLRALRVTAGVSKGQADLLDSAAAVTQRQATTTAEIADFHAQNRAKIQQQNQKLENLFPELRTLNRDIG